MDSESDQSQPAIGAASVETTLASEAVPAPGTAMNAPGTDDASLACFVLERASNRTLTFEESTP